jgi:PKHD-type hydroxylase
MVLNGLNRSPLFFSAALPLRIFTPRINRYGGEANTYGNHIDNAIRLKVSEAGQTEYVRTDVSCTVFLNEPDEYEGGELTVSDTYGTRGVKLPAGHAVLYPGTSLHQVTPVTRGHRVACFLWVQSMVRSDEQRRLLYELDMNILALRQQHGETPEATALTGTYHNLLRMWAQT